MHNQNLGDHITTSPVPGQPDRINWKTDESDTLQILIQQKQMELAELMRKAQEIAEEKAREACPHCGRMEKRMPHPQPVPLPNPPPPMVGSYPMGVPYGNPIGVSELEDFYKRQERSK